MIIQSSNLFDISTLTLRSSQLAVTARMNPFMSVQGKGQANTTAKADDHPHDVLHFWVCIDTYKLQV